MLLHAQEVIAFGQIVEREVCHPPEDAIEVDARIGWHGGDGEPGRKRFEGEGEVGGLAGLKGEGVVDGLIAAQTQR